MKIFCNFVKLYGTMKFEDLDSKAFEVKLQSINPKLRLKMLKYIISTMELHVFILPTKSQSDSLMVWTTTDN